MQKGLKQFDKVDEDCTDKACACKTKPLNIKEDKDDE